MITSRPVRFLLFAYAVAGFGFIFLPILTNVVFSFDSNRFSSLPLGGFTTDWYADLGDDNEMRHAFFNSFVVAASVGVISTVLGFCAAYTDYRYQFPGKTAYLLLALLPPTIPVAILGITLLIYFSEIGLFGGRPAIIVAHVIYTIPFAMGLVRLRLSQMDQNLEAAAWNLGAGPWAALFYIILPFTAPALLAAMFLTMAVSFDEFVMAWLMGGFNETIPVHILSLLQREMSPRINAIGGVVFTVSIVLLLLANWTYTARSHARSR